MAADKLSVLVCNLDDGIGLLESELASVRLGCIELCWTLDETLKSLESLALPFGHLRVSLGQSPLCY
jgi:hypothetical protein